MDQELITYLDRRFGDQDGKFEGLTGQIEALREHVDTQIRETQIMVEGLRSTIETVAESVVATNAKLDRSHEDHESKRQEDGAFCTSLFLDVKGRVDDHEDRLGDCEARLKRMESAGG